MQLLAKRIKVKQLEVGKFYLCQRARGEFSSINIYVGQNYKGYYVFYNVLNIRITTDKYGNTLQPNTNVELGTEKMFSMYKEIIKEMMTIPVVKENIRIISGITGVYNQIDLGFDAKKFIEREKAAFDFGGDAKLKIVTASKINTEDMYISSDMNILYSFRQLDYITETEYRYVFSTLYFYGSQRKCSVVRPMTFPKLYKLSDVLANSFALENFKRKNPLLYQFVIEERKRNLKEKIHCNINL